MDAEFAFFQEVESAITRSSGARRAEMAKRLADLLSANASRYSDDEMTLLDDVFVRLVATIEESSRALLAAQLAPMFKAPPRILSALACDDAIVVASPVLTQCDGLNDQTLIVCAETKSQGHLLAISRRRTIGEALTDILVERGDQRVVLSTAQNAGAKFSTKGFNVLVNRSRDDDRLAICVGTRPDVPARIFRQLLDSASSIVRAKLEAESPHLKHEIGGLVTELAARIETRATVLSPKYAAAHVLVESLNQAGKLNTEKLEAFATADRYEDTVAGLALMSGVPIDVVEHKLNDGFVEFLLILAKAIGLSWITTRVVLLMLGVRHQRCAADDVDAGLATFQQLNRETARRVLNVYRIEAAN
jgi:uncharacterized protein (DUF2336 family)